MRARDEKYNFILFISYFLLLLQHEVFRGTQTKNLQTIEIKQRTNIMKYPIGIQNFGEIRRGGYVYVDKPAVFWRALRSGYLKYIGLKSSIVFWVK
jgi:hypothetical protein